MEAAVESTGGALGFGLFFTIVRASRRLFDVCKAGISWIMAKAQIASIWDKMCELAKLHVKNGLDPRLARKDGYFDQRRNPYACFNRSLKQLRTAVEEKLVDVWKSGLRLLATGLEMIPVVGTGARRLADSGINYCAGNAKKNLQLTEASKEEAVSASAQLVDDISFEVKQRGLKEIEAAFLANPGDDIVSGIANLIF